MNSWRTTVTGIVEIIIGLLGLLISILGIGIPEGVALPTAGGAIAIIVAGIQGLAARDNKVSSEQAGAK